MTIGMCLGRGLEGLVGVGGGLKGSGEGVELGEGNADEDGVE
jgi:hypothetical protein